MKLMLLLLILPFTLNLQNLRHKTKTKSGCSQNEIEGILIFEGSTNKPYCLSVPLDNRQIFSNLLENKHGRNYFELSETTKMNRLSFFIDDSNQILKKHLWRLSL
jgi:hypothetical protein